MEREYLRLRGESDRAYKSACKLSEYHTNFMAFKLYMGRAHGLAREAGMILNAMPADRQMHYRGEALAAMALGFVCGLHGVAL